MKLKYISSASTFFIMGEYYKIIDQSFFTGTLYYKCINPHGDLQWFNAVNFQTREDRRGEILDQLLDKNDMNFK